MLKAELKSEPNVAATQLPNSDSFISKVVSSVGGSILSADDSIRYVIVRKEVYMCITDLRLLTRSETQYRTRFNVGALLWPTLPAGKAPLVQL